MGPGSPKCSVVIRSFNEEKHIARLLTGILRQSIKDVEIILVDSGSTDATTAIASRYPVKVVSIDPAEFTFGRSLNHGIHEAKGEFVLISSAHVFPLYSDWIERMLAPFADPEVALVYGRQKGDENTKYSESQVFAAWFPNRSLPRQNHPFCNNANAAIRRALWEIRPYDEALPGLEDLDWASWAIDQEFTVSYVAEAEVIHVHDETARMIYNRYRREAMAMKRIRPQEKFHFRDFLRLLISNVFSDWRHAAKDGVFVESFFGVVGFRLMQFWGTYRGFALSGSLTSDLKRTFYYPRDSAQTSQQARRQAEPIDYTISDRSEPMIVPDEGNYEE